MIKLAYLGIIRSLLVSLMFIVPMIVYQDFIPFEYKLMSDSSYHVWKQAQLDADMGAKDYDTTPNTCSWYGADHVMRSPDDPYSPVAKVCRHTRGWNGYVETFGISLNEESVDP